MTDLFPHLFGNILHGIMLRLFRQMFLSQLGRSQNPQSCCAFQRQRGILSINPEGYSGRFFTRSSIHPFIHSFFPSLFKTQFLIIHSTPGPQVGARNPSGNRPKPLPSLCFCSGCWDNKQLKAVAGSMGTRVEQEFKAGKGAGQKGYSPSPVMKDPATTAPCLSQPQKGTRQQAGAEKVHQDMFPNSENALNQCCRRNAPHHVAKVQRRVYLECT